MTLEKPWGRPFDELVRLLGSKWGGEVTGYARGTGADFYFYPEYQVERDGRRIEIGISEFPGQSASVMEGADNTEYLRVRVSMEAARAITISREGLTEKLKKLVGLAREYETGDPEFDGRYWLQVGSSDDEAVLGRSGVREAVRSLAPFERITVDRGGVLTSRRIDGKKDLAVEAVVAFGNRAIDLARSMD